MKLARVRMRNFRCFKKNDGTWYDWLPNKDLNLLIGPNGSGKTALVEAIDIVLNCEGRSNRALITEYDFPSCDIGKTIEIEIVLTELGAVLGDFDSAIEFFDNRSGELVDEIDEEHDESKYDRCIRIRFEAHRNQDDGEIEWHWTLPKFVETEYEEAKELTKKQHEAIGYFRINPAISAGAFTLNQYSALGRHLRKLKYKLGKLPHKLTPKQVMPECIFDGLTCDNCGEKTACLNMSEDNETELPLGQMLNQVMSKAEKMLGENSWSGMKSSLGPRFGDLRSSLAAMTVGLRPIDVADKFIPFERLSSGEKYALSFALASTQIPGAITPIIVMEEPETALYPSAIGQIIANLYKTNSPQVIITSHSEAVVRRFSLEDIFVMDSEKKPVPLESCLETGVNRADFECLIMPGRTSALFVEKLIIAEGAMDAIVSGELDRLAGAVSSPGKEQTSFASKNWCFFDASGSEHLLEKADALKKLGKKIVLLFDGDKMSTADRTKDKYPTFIYKSSKESDPAIELALLHGMQENQQAEAIKDFHSFPECAECTVWKNDIKNCLNKNGCPLKESKPELKAKFNRSCLKEYHETKTFPPAFNSLLAELDSAQAGKIIELKIEKQ